MSTYIPKEADKVPEPTLRRLPWYLSNIKLMKEKGDNTFLLHKSLRK